MADNSHELLKEQRQRAYGLYEQSSKSLRLTLIWAMGLALVLFPLTFYPYTQFRGERYLLQAQLAELDDQIPSIRRDVDEMGQLLNDFYGVKQSIDQSLASLDVRDLQENSTRHAEELAAIRTAYGDDPDAERWLAGEIDSKKLPASLKRKPDLKAATDDPCFPLDSEAWVRCAFAAQVRSVHYEASGHFASGHISHLRNTLFAPLSDSLEELHEAFRAWLLGEESSWPPEGLKREATLADHANAFEQAYHDRIEENFRSIIDRRNGTQDELSQLESEHNAADERLKDVTGKLEEIAALQNIETPFGRLPVGVNDLMLLFPILLAAGVLRLAQLENEAMARRRLYDDLSFRVDPEAEVLDRTHFTTVAALWIDPLQPITRLLLGIATFVLPAVIFGYSVALLFQNRLLTDAAMTEVRLPAAFYVTFYAVMALAILFLGYRIFRGFRAYRRYRSLRVAAT